MTLSLRAQGSKNHDLLQRIQFDLWTRTGAACWRSLSRLDDAKWHDQVRHGMLVCSNGTLMPKRVLIMILHFLSGALCPHPPQLH